METNSGVPTIPWGTSEQKEVHNQQTNVKSKTWREKLNLSLFYSGLIRFPIDFMLPDAFATLRCLGFLGVFTDETGREGGVAV
jgi:hypothetical protein